MAIKLAELINLSIILKSLDGMHEGRVAIKEKHSNPNSYYIFHTKEGKFIRITSSGPTDRVVLREYNHQPCLEYVMLQKPTFVE